MRKDEWLMKLRRYDRDGAIKYLAKRIYESFDHGEFSRYWQGIHAGFEDFQPLHTLSDTQLGEIADEVIGDDWD